MTVDPKELAAALAEPFPADDIGWKPQTTSKDGNKALACAYIDARNVMDRLDAVVGPENWQDDFEVMPNGNVVCRLSLRVGGEWITKTDVGGESDQRDPGDREKAAFSDALKRAAVKWGVGRYLYSLQAVWCEYDPKKKQFKVTPKLPASALPRGETTAQHASPRQPLAAPPASKSNPLPKDGVELFARLKDYEAKLVAAGLCQPRELTGYVEDEGEKKLFPKSMGDWKGEQIKQAVQWAKDCEASLQRRAATRKTEPLGVK